MDTIKIEKKNTLMVAHRGVSGLEKENTLAAFVAAGNRSYYGVETDVHRTADGKYVVIHDSDTARVSPLHVEIEKSAYDTIRGVMLNDIDGTCGRTDLRVPSLEEYIKVCKRYGKYCILELKARMPTRTSPTSSASSTSRTIWTTSSSSPSRSRTSSTCASSSPTSPRSG